MMKQSIARVGTGFRRVRGMEKQPWLRIPEGFLHKQVSVVGHLLIPDMLLYLELFLHKHLQVKQ